MIYASSDVRFQMSDVRKGGELQNVMNNELRLAAHESAKSHDLRLRRMNCACAHYGRGFTLYRRKAFPRTESCFVVGSLLIISDGELVGLGESLSRRSDSGWQARTGLFLPLPAAAAKVRLRRTQPPWCGQAEIFSQPQTYRLKAQSKLTKNLQTESRLSKGTIQPLPRQAIRGRNEP